MYFYIAMKHPATLLCLALLAYSCQPHSENTNEQKNSLKATETELIKNIARFPDSFLLKESLIQFYREHNDYSKGIASINSILSQDSNNARCWHIKGVLHFENNDTLEAINSFERELSLIPNPAAMVSLGTLYAETKNEKCLPLANLLRKYDGNKLAKEAAYIKGAYYSSIKNYPKAIHHFDSCINIDFTFMEAYREKAIALNHLKQFKGAIDILKKAVTLQNNYAEGYYYMGLNYEEIKDTSAAIECFQKAILYDPSDEASALELKKLQP